MKRVRSEPFVDEVTVEVVAGRGGDGVVHFRREAYVPRGGPDGGDGGRGGDVVLAATPHLNTLSALRRRRRIVAEDGRPGGGSRMTGRSGSSVVVEVPVGTMVYDDETGDLLADLDHAGARWTAARGGRGGRGNWHFRSPTDRAPRRATPGRPGERRRLRLELRLLADVGLVGFPNAGKSSLIRRLTAARPKVADYPFTTLTPQLGVVDDPYGDGFVIADLPGLIAGAAEGVGLGHRFLRHVARTRLLVHVLDGGAGDVEELCARHRTILAELAAAPVPIAAAVELVVLNKADLLPEAERVPLAEALAERLGLPVLWTSTVSGLGLDRLRTELMRRLTARRAGAVQTPPASEEMAG